MSKYNLLVFLMFKIAIFDDFHTAVNNFSFSNTIKYLLYINKIFIIILNNRITINTNIKTSKYLIHIKRILNKNQFNILMNLNSLNKLLYSNMGKNL